eukprot:c11719_g1_i1.p1 GENE.c11719_g1_i1~~c11719_g1_i1.p1  ORF type:complete len:190 (+),score=39.03 c11719_g1_i1:64-570(+)
MDLDGKPDVWNAKLRAQLAPELRPQVQQQPDAMEMIKSMVDRHEPPPSFFSQMFREDDVPGLILAKGLLDSMTPNFKLPPGATVPLAPGIAHMVVGSGRNFAIPNIAKNQMSGVQRDAIDAAARSFSVLENNPQDSRGNIVTDAWGTRQSLAHPRAPIFPGSFQQPFY